MRFFRFECIFLLQTDLHYVILDMKVRESETKNQVEDKMYVYDNLYLTHFAKSEDPAKDYQHNFAKSIADRYGNDRYLEGYYAVSADAAETLRDLAEEQVAEYEDGLKEGEVYAECLLEAEVLFHIASSVYDLCENSFEEEETWTRWNEVKSKYGC